MSLQKRNNFEEPTRQSKVALVLLLLKYYKIIFRQVWFIFVYVILKQKAGNIWSIVVYILIGISVIAIVFSVLSYLRYYFYIKDNELYIEKGIFKKTKTNIPFERIQSVNFEQNVILQVFDHVKVEVETAGSKGKEFVITALEKKQAKALSDYILTNKESALTEETTETEEIVQSQEEKTTLFSLSFGQLAKIGLTENHLRSGLWVIGIFFYLYSNLDDLGIDLFKMMEERGLDNLSLGFMLSSILILLSLVFLVLISVVRVFLRYFDLKMEREKDGFVVHMGLLNHKEFKAKDRKIQMMSWSNNLLRKWLGIFSFSFHQAGSQGGGKNNFAFPITEERNIEAIAEYVFGPKSLEYSQYIKIDKWYFQRQILLKVVPLLIVGIGLFYWSKNYVVLVVSALLLTYIVFINYYRYKRSLFYYNEEYIKMYKSVIGESQMLLPFYKVQTVDIRQTFFQRRRNLANLVLHSAAGKVVLPYISIESARFLRDYALYKAESTERSWM